MTRLDKERIIEGRFSEGAPESEERALVRGLDEQLHGGLTDAAIEVFAQLEGVAQTARGAAYAVQRTLPFDMRRKIEVPDANLAGIFEAGEGIDVVSKIIATTDTIQRLSSTALETMALPTDQKEPFMAAVAAGIHLANPNDGRFLGRLTRARDRRLAELEVLGIPPGFYEATQVPAIRATLEYAQALARIWVRVYESAAGHFDAYLGLKDISQVMMAVKEGCEVAREDLVHTKMESLKMIKELRPKVDKLGRRLLRDHEKMDGDEFLELSEKYGRRVDKLELAVLQGNQATMEISIDLMRELQAVQASMMAGESGNDLMALVIEEWRIMYACELGVTNTFQAVAGLLTAASTGVRRLQRMALTNESGYSLGEDKVFLDKVERIREILRTYKRLVRESGRLLLTDANGQDRANAEKRMQQIVGDHRRDKRSR